MNESKLPLSVSMAALSVGAAVQDWITAHLSIASIIAIVAGVLSIWASIETARLRRAQRRRIEREDYE